MRRRKILATAYSCEPGVGSEGGIGWSWVSEIARRHELWLLTRRNNLPAIEAAARALGIEGLHAVGFDLPAWARFFKRGPRGAVLYFYLWQVAIAREAVRLDRMVGFDLVHHLTFASSWIPSGLAFVKKPFVWGPVGRHPRVPDRFLEASDWRERCAELARAGVKRVLEGLDPLLRLTQSRADLILCIDSYAASRLAPAHRPKIVPFLACGTEREALPAARFERGRPFEILYAGRLVDLKGVRLALAAFAQFAGHVPESRLILVGEGPRRAVLEARIRALDLGGRVELAGHVPRPEVLRRMRRSDVFLFPSFEGAGMVVVEALAAGNPVVCLDSGGPREMVGSDRGIKVPVGESFAATAAGLAGALARLYEDEALRSTLAKGAHRWATEHACWEAKGRKLEDLYARAEAHHAEKRHAEAA